MQDRKGVHVAVFRDDNNEEHLALILPPHFLRTPIPVVRCRFQSQRQPPLISLSSWLLQDLVQLVQHFRYVYMFSPLSGSLIPLIRPGDGISPAERCEPAGVQL